ncbi:MAG TPA: glycoside hydrolase family 3 N-terminal domain-containing protein [Gaiellaceae bacterium]|jgi:beta-N-acetylhexosaminidase|nr:glycoside hydrolase family 3 N-terminal domain-containing protein [Gaiellaceae bacterium]
MGALLVHAIAALVAGAQPAVAELTPRQKAALVVVSPLPAPPGVGGVIVRPGTRALPRPPDALVFVDQEGGPTRVFPDLPPVRAAAAYTRASQAYWAGRATGRALRSLGVGVDLAPVLDSPDGPLGSRQFPRTSFGVAFERGLVAVGAGSCAKHFPGLGSAAISTDDAPHVNAVLRPREIAGFRAAIEAGAPCVMVNHAFYRKLGRRRASLEPATYRLLRSLGFRGLTITDSLSIVSPFPSDWPVTAARAGADLLLFTRGSDAERAIDLLLPLARSGGLDAHVARVLRFRARYVVG